VYAATVGVADGSIPSAARGPVVVIGGDGGVVGEILMLVQWLRFLHKCESRCPSWLS